MDQTRLLMLNSERVSLQKMLSVIPEDDVIDRGSLLAKLEEVESIIKQGLPERFTTKTKLTFRGKPVIGSHGIYADFGTRALSGFTEAVAAVAASLTAPLNAMGPIPNRDQSQLLITNTAVGSFGFELEELPHAQLKLGEASLVEQAIEKTQNLLAAAAQADDDALADSVSELDQRAIDKIRGFVETLHANEALCAVEFKGKKFRFSSSSEIKRTIERISSSNLHEKAEEILGCFVGAMPYKRRTFEYRVEQTEEVLVGRFGPGVLHPEEINLHIEERCIAKFAVTRVGQGKPRYLLIEKPQWEQEKSS